MGTHGGLHGLIRSPILRRYGPLAFLVAWAVVTHPAWFLDLRPLTWGDWNFLRPETMQAWLASPQAWNRENGLGVLDYLNLDYYPQLVGLGLLSRSGISFAVAERLLYMWPAALLPLFGAYSLARHVGGNRIASVLAALVYGTNAYILVIQWQQLTIAVAYGLAPLAFLAYLQSLESRRLSWMLGTSLLLSITFLFDPRVAIIVAGLIAAWTVGRALRELARRVRHAAMNLSMPGGVVRPTDRHPDILREATASGQSHETAMGRIASSSWVPLGVVAGVTTALCAHWVVPLVLSGGSATQELLSGQPFGSYLNLNYAFLLNHPFWTGGFPAFFRDQPPVAVFAVFPILAFAALLVRRRVAVAAFALVGLLGLFLTKQTTAPFAEVYTWLFFNLPGFNLYREGSKFFLLVALAYVPLTALTVTHFAGRLPTMSRCRKLIALAVVAGLAAAVIVPAVPASNGQLGGLFAPVPVPGEYDLVSQVLLGNSTGNTFYRTFWWPSFERFGAHTTTVPALSGFDAAQTYLHTYLENPKDFRSLLNNTETAAILSLAAVRFVVVPYDPLGEIYPLLGPQSFFYGQVASQSWLRQLDLPGVHSAIFVNAFARPYVYGSSTPIDRLRIGDPTQALTTTQNVTFELQPEGATVDFPAPPAVQTIVLSERFDPGWQLVCPNGFRAAAQGVFGLTAFPTPGPTAQECRIEYDLQPGTNAGFVVSGVAYAVTVGVLGAGTILRYIRRRRTGSLNRP